MKKNLLLLAGFLLLCSVAFLIFTSLRKTNDFSNWSNVCVEWVRPVSVGYIKPFWPWSPDSEWLAYNNVPPEEHMPKGVKVDESQRGAWVMKYDGTDKRLLALGGRRPSFGRYQWKVVFSRDGASGQKGPKIGLEEDIWMIDFDGKNEVQLTSGVRDDKMKILGGSPITYDGEQVLYLIMGTGVGIVNADSTNPRTLIDHSGHAAGFSLDGKRVFTTDHCVVKNGKVDTGIGCGGFIDLNDISKREWLTKIKFPENDYWHLNMNLDATLITFDNPRWENRNVWIAKLNGSNEHIQLTDYKSKLNEWGVWGNHPRFSPDGKWIVYDEQSLAEKGQGVKNKVMIINVATKEKKEIYGVIVPKHSGWAEPGWSPDGKKIVFYAPDPNNQNLPSVWVAELKNCKN